MRAAGVTHLSGAVGVEFHLEMPDSWSEKKKAKMDGEPHQQKPDVDNLLKSVLDCVRSDAHVHTVAARKVWSRTAYILLEVDAQTC
jgi:Holliday junction resolvase RusA-like endonuclease